MTENHPAATSTGRGTKGAVSESGSMPQRALYRANWSRTVQPDARQNWEANTGELQAGRSFKCRGGDSIGTALVDSPTTRQERVTPRSSRKRTESTSVELTGRRAHHNGMADSPDGNPAECQETSAHCGANPVLGGSRSVSRPPKAVGKFNCP